MHFIAFIWSFPFHTFSHSMRISFRSEFGVSFSIICFQSLFLALFHFFRLLLNVLCRFFHMLFIDSVFRCAWCCFCFSVLSCISYCTNPHTAYRPQIVRQNVLFILYAHCYAFLFPFFPFLALTHYLPISP